MRFPGLALALFSAAALIGCGSSPAPVTISGATLNGNWNIVGTGAITSYPSLSFSLVAIGGELYAHGGMGYGCSNGSAGGGGGISLSGPIASDGSFQLTQVSGVVISQNGSPIVVAVSGTAPQAGATGWSGTYSITSAAGTTGCVVNESGNFTAVPYALVDGTFAGPLLVGATGAGGVNLSIAVTQGTNPVELQSGTLAPSYYLPISGTAAVLGVPCFTQGATNPAAPPLPNNNTVQGSGVVAAFVMNDGSQMIVLGDLSTTQSTVLQRVSVTIFGGQCSGVYSGTLTRQ